MADEARTVTNTTAGLSVNSDYDVAVDTIAGKDYQRVKLDAGADGAVLPVVAGQQTAANSLPVVLASDQFQASPVGMQITQNISVDAGCTTTTINKSAHTVLVGDIVQNRTTASRYGMARVTAIATNSFTVSPPLPVAPSASDLLSILRPSAFVVDTNLQLQASLFGSNSATVVFLEDNAANNNDNLIPAGAVRRDTPSTTTTTDGDYTNLTTDSSNRLWVNGSGVTQPVSAASLPLPSGAATSAAQTDKSQFTKITDGTDTVEVENAATYSTSIPYTTKGATVNSRAQQIWDPNHPDNDGSGADEAFYGQNQDSNGNLCSNLSSVRGKLLRYRNQVGTTASGTNPPPLWIGGAAATVTPSSVTAGRAVDGYWSKSGHLVVNIDSVREQNGDQLTTLTSTTTATAIVTADATYMNDLTGLIITNTSATATDVILYNDDGTTERTHIYCPAGDTRGIVFGKPFKQTAINKAWKAKTVTSVASVYITAQFSKQL